MGTTQSELAGPDLAQGIPAADLADGGMLAGHVGEEAVLLARAGNEIFAVGALCTHYNGPLAERLPRLRAKLASAELVVPVHHEPETDAPDLGGWFLIYAIPAEDGPQLWIAGPPEPEPELPAELDVAGWKLPEPLRELYAQHHGLGVLCEELLELVLDG